MSKCQIYIKILNRIMAFKSYKNLEVLKKMRGCNTYENKEEMLKDIYKKRKEKR